MPVCNIMPRFRVKISAYGAVPVSISYLLQPKCPLQDPRSVGYFFISFFALNILNLMHRLDSNQRTKFVICENCLYTDSICAFYDANRYCVECLCDHACCPECSSGYHAITIADQAFIGWALALGNSIIRSVIAIVLVNSVLVSDSLNQVCRTTRRGIN